MFWRRACKGIRIPESETFLLVESGIQLKESAIPLTIESGFQVLLIRSGIQCLESGIHAVESRIQDTFFLYTAQTQVSMFKITETLHVSPTGRQADENTSLVLIGLKAIV